MQLLRPPRTGTNGVTAVKQHRDVLYPDTEENLRW
jgi:hypothetical protein